MDKLKAFGKSNAAVYILLALFSLLLACMLQEYDNDLYARLIVGEHFFKTGWISYEDFLSYTPTHAWYDHEWGASVIFYLFFKLFGNFGLILVYALTMFVTTFFVVKTQKLQVSAYPFSIFFIVCFMLLFSHQNPSIVRCHMFSFMFFSILLYILEKTRLKGSNLLWIMPFIFVLWNNIHGGVVSGLGMLFIYMVGAFLMRKPWKKYFGVLATSTILLIINPYGAEYLNFLFSANTMSRKYITEWWAVFAYRHIVYYYPLFFAIFFTVCIAIVNAFSKKKFDLIKLLALLLTAYLGFAHVKLLSLGLIVAAALFYNDLISLLTKNKLRFLNKLTAIIVLVAIFYIPFTNPARARTSPIKYPVLEVEFLKQNDIKGNLITSFGLGSYASYKLYPNNLIYMDGRYEEVYNNEEFNNLKDYEMGAPNWAEILEKYSTEILMPVKEQEIYSILQNNSDWEEVYTGPLCGVFLKKDRVKYKNNFIQPTFDITYYEQREFENLGKFGE